jgi:hypothetical protein
MCYRCLMGISENAEKVIRLVPQPPLEVQLTQQVNHEAVSIAKRILEMAEKGEILHLVVAYETPDRYDGEGTGIDIAKHLGMLDLVRFRFLSAHCLPEFLPR